MTHAFAPHPLSIAPQTGLAGAIRSLNPAALLFLAAVVVSSTVAMANVPVARWLESSLQQAQQLPALEPAAEADAAGEGAVKPRARTRCNACGVVEAIRRVEAMGNLPAAYEFTVRLRDGSTRLTSDVSPAKWRAGDAIMLLGGAGSVTQH